MPKGVYERRKRAGKREEILNAAAKIYAHYGFEGATIERMAKEAGVSKSLVLSYFENKQELVRTIAERAVNQTMSRIQEIDSTAGLTLRRREALIHDFMKADREQWCLILGTLLVPNFQFQGRSEIVEYFQGGRQTAAAHLKELRNPTIQSAQAYAYNSVCLHTVFLIGGLEDEYQQAMERHMALYLLPEDGNDDNVPR